MKISKWPAGTGAVIAVLLLWGSCSSLPKDQAQKPVSQSRVKAAEYTASGNLRLNRGDFAQAATFFEMARDMNLSVDNQEGAAESYNSLGKVYLATGDLAGAEAQFLRALSIAGSLKDPLLEGRTLGLQGELMIARGDTAAATDLINRGLALLAGDDIGRAVLLHNLATALKQEQRFAEAEEALRSAVALNEKNKQYSELGGNYYLLASLASRQERYPEALEHAAKALENDKIVENHLGIALDLFAFGRIYQNQKDWERAHDHFFRAFLVYETLGLTRKMIDTLAYLEECAEALGNRENQELYTTTRTILEESL